MRQIVLRRLEVQGFKSFINPTTIDLNREGFILVAGENRVEPRLGANGAGKSSIWDALCFCLYGTSVRGGTRIGELVSHGGTRLSVVLHLEIDGQEHTISRVGPPNRLTLDGQVVELVDIERLVGLSRSRFLSSVVFGQAVPLFIDLPVPARGELLDEILDLAVWMRAADEATRRHGAVGRDLSALQVSIARVEGALGALEPLESIQARSNSWADDHEAAISALLDQFAEREEALRILEESRPSLPTVSTSTLRSIYEAKREVEAQLQTSRARAEQRHATILEEIAFFKGAGANCPVCSQPITEEFTEEHLRELNAREAEQLEALREIVGNLADVRGDANEALQAWHLANEAEKTAQSHAGGYAARLESARRGLDDLERQIESIGAATNPYSARLAEVTQQMAELTQERDQLGQRKRMLTQHLASLDYWRDGFRKVRLFCIRRVLQQLEVETMNVTVQLGLVGWHIAFTTESETKSGTVRTGVQVEIDSPLMRGSMSTWSPGEGQRVRLATALGLASLIQRWAGVRWNLEVLDEPTAWLSEAGIEDLLESLQQRAVVTGRSVYLCDHRALNASGFTGVVRVVKDPEGSRINWE